MPETYFVASNIELMDALREARAGDRIELAAGDYGHLDLYDARSPFVKKSGTVTIASQFEDQPARFSKITVTGAENLAFQDLVFDYHTPAAVQYDKPFRFQSSSGIELKGLTVQGADPAVGQGLNFRDCQDIVVEELSLSTFHRGIVVTGSQNVHISDSVLVDMGSDGIDLAGVDNVSIIGNTLKDFAADPDDGSHRDFIQFWTAGGAGASSDVLISGNKMAGSDVQAIFMRSETMDDTGSPVRYKNVSITDNTIFTDDWHGIHTAPTDGLTVVGNTVLPFTLDFKGASSAPTIFVEDISAEVTITNNVITGIEDTTSPDWLAWADGNLILQDHTPSSEHYLPDYLLANSTGSQFGPHLLDPFEVAENMGSASSHIDPSLNGARVQIIGDSHGEFHLDAASSSFGGVFLSEDTAEFIWTLPNGAQMNGQTLGLKLLEGATDIKLAITVAGDVVLEQTIVLHVDEQTALTVVATESAVVAEVDGQAQILDAATTTVLGNTGLILRPGHTLAIDPGDSFDMRDFLIEFDFALTDPEATGHIMRVHGDWLVQITPAGGLEFWFWDSSGTRTVLATEDIDFRDGVMRHVQIAREFDTGHAAILVDGAVSGQGDIAGYSGPAGSHDLVIGDIFSWTSATGWLDNIAIEHVLPPVIAEAVAPESHWIVLEDGLISVFGEATLLPDEEQNFPTPVHNIPQVPIAPVEVTLEGSNIKDKLRGTDGDDGILGGGGKDALYGRDGSDEIFGEQGNDRLFGGKGDDTIVGGQGKDKLQGNRGDDLLFGGNGDDNLRGGDGHDVIYGGAGRDLLSGGDGEDIFVVQMMGGYDTIYDFRVGEDSLALLNISVQDLVVSEHVQGTMVLVSEDDMVLFKGLYDLDIWDLFGA